MAIAAPDDAALGAIEAAATALGQRLTVRGAGADAIDRVRAAIRAPGPPQVVVLAAAGAEAVVGVASTVSPRPVLVLVGGGATSALAARAAALDVELFAVAPYDLDRLAPVLAAAAQLAHTRAELNLARGSELLLRRRLDQLTAADEHSGLHGFELVRRVLELELRRARRYGYPLAVALVELTLGRGGTAGAAGVQRILRVRASAALTGAIRDIDLACELDDGRYFVLLPYTDRKAAGQVAHRIIRSIAALPAVTSAGHSHRAEARAGVAAGHPDGGSFARLMKDATAALAEAHREGADLVVLVILRGTTVVTAVLGDPIAHSRSPAIIGAAFAAAGLDGVMVPLRVPAAAVAQVVPALAAGRARRQRDGAAQAGGDRVLRRAHAACAPGRRGQLPRPRRRPRRRRQHRRRRPPGRPRRPRVGGRRSRGGGARRRRRGALRRDQPGRRRRAHPGDRATPGGGRLVAGGPGRRLGRRDAWGRAGRRRPAGRRDLHRPRPGDRGGGGGRAAPRRLAGPRRRGVAGVPP
ncbi:MAG: diguanylate cyclase [Kofleriaceae bacterium]